MWSNLCTRTLLEAERTENARLQNVVGRKTESIWSMNKADLVEKARLELGMTQAQAEKETVVTLRERIRSRRELTETSKDPFTKLPKGLDSLKKEELAVECKLRTIHMPEGATRPMMILAIREDVANHATMAQRHPPQEWEMTDEVAGPSSKRRVEPGTRL